MDYFKLFDIEASFKLDLSELRKAYYAKSMEFHPDRYGLKSAEEQNKAIDMSTLINSAYKVLSDELSRIKYLLEISGIEFAEGKDTVPQDFLVEVMDINEMIMDYKLDPTLESKDEVFRQISSLKSSLLDKQGNLLEKFKNQKTDKKQLELIKDYYLKCKYLKRIKLNLEN